MNIRRISLFVIFLGVAACRQPAVPTAQTKAPAKPAAAVDAVPALLGLGTVVKDCKQVGSYKGCRRQLVGRTHRVLMQFGDQIDDFVDVIANTPDDRAKSVQPYLDWIGERWWVLPNPMYGSWVPAQFNNDWTKPRTARRRAEINALRTN